MSLKNILVQLFIFYFLLGCAPMNKPSHQETLKEKKIYLEIALEKFGENIEYELNTDKSYALCKKMLAVPVLNPNQLIEFFVYDIQEDKIIYEDKLANAKISWHNNTQLLITKQKGYITTPTDTGKWTYIFDLQSNKKITPRLTK